MGAVFGSYNALCGPTNRHTVGLEYKLVRKRHGFGGIDLSHVKRG